VFADSHSPVLHAFLHILRGCIPRGVLSLCLMEYYLTVGLLLVCVGGVFIWKVLIKHSCWAGHWTL